MRLRDVCNLVSRYLVQAPLPPLPPLPSFLPSFLPLALDPNRHARHPSTQKKHLLFKSPSLRNHNQYRPHWTCLSDREQQLSRGTRYAVLDLEMRSGQIICPLPDEASLATGHRGTWAPGQLGNWAPHTHIHIHHAIPVYFLRR